MGQTKRALSTSCAARQLYSPNQKQPLPSGPCEQPSGLSLCLLLWTTLFSCPVYLPILVSLSSLISSLFVFSSLIFFSEYIWGHIFFMGWEPWGGGEGKGEEGRGRRGGGWNGQIKDRCWKAFFLDLGAVCWKWVLGTWEREVTGKTKQLHFSIFSIPASFPKGSE